jgi:hypothetical protein
MNQNRQLDEPIGCCFRMQCQSYFRLNVTVGDETQQCVKGGTEISFTGFSGSVICPDPKIVCGLANYPADLTLGGEVLLDGLIHM